MLREKCSVREIAFVDDTFLLDKQRVYKLFELLDNASIHFFWTCLSRINDVSYEFLEYLKAKGCWHISFGIESGDENILKIIKKGVSLTKAEQVVNWCKKLNIKTKGFFIVGHPMETIDTINKSIKYACSVKLDDVLVTINTPLPGSQQYTEVSKYGFLAETDWSQFSCWRPVFVPNGLTQDILLNKQKEFYRRFYFRPRIIMRYAQSFLGRGGLKRLLTVLKAAMFVFRGSKNRKDQRANFKRNDAV